MTPEEKEQVKNLLWSIETQNYSIYEKCNYIQTKMEEINTLIEEVRDIENVRYNNIVLIHQLIKD